MPLWPVSIVLGGATIPLDEVEAAVAIHHGRTDVFDDPTATTCQVTLLDRGRDFVEAFDVGQSLAVRVGPPEAIGPIDPGLAAGAASPNWSSYDGGNPTVTLAATPLASRGGVGLRATRTGANGRIGAMYSIGLSPQLDAMKGKTIEWAGDVKAPAGHQIWAYADWYSPAHGWGAGDAQKIASGGWDRVRVTFGPVWDDATAVHVYFWDDNGVVGGVVDVDRWWLGSPGLDPALSSPRFTGRITDATLDVDDLTVIGVAALSTLRGYEIGATVDWPEEAWSARVSRAFTEAGLADLLELQPDPTFDPVLAARVVETAGPTTLGDYLTFLAGMVGAAVVDRLDGRILVQAIGARTVTSPTPIDPAIVAYAPQWVEALPRANIVTVRYQADQGASVTYRDEASIDQYAERPGTIDTAFRDAADATRRANLALGRGAAIFAPILRALELRIGEPVELTRLPAASPYDPWTPIVEGWSDDIAGDKWTMTLALSDPLWSGAVLVWVAVPTAETWATIDQTTHWADALSLDDLTPD